MNPHEKQTPRKLTIALAGNPNSGKTTTFNILTGTRQKVGNWPGVTVEKKEGIVHRQGYELKIIDLPGTYSLTPFSIEEIVARDFILDEKPDVVVDIIDASNLERSLYLATQLRELDCKVVFALNMADLAKSRGVQIDAEKLSELLQVPVVFTVGNKNRGIEELLRAAIKTGESGERVPEKRRVRYSHDIEGAIERLAPFIRERVRDDFSYNRRWTAIKLLENDEILKQRLQEKLPPEVNAEIQELAEELRRHLESRYEDDPQIRMTDERYGFIAGIVKEAVTTSRLQRVDVSRNVDLVLTNRYLGFPIFIFFIWAMFELTFTLGEYPMYGIDIGISHATAFLETLLPESFFRDLLLHGIIAGVGSVIVFLPNILILFFCIAIFEDTGYMSRAAFLMDKIMHVIGLHGKSFIPMLMGFGCSVPAIMATRTLESEKDRILTILITPFMSCSAKLPVYIVLAGTFFGKKAGTVIFSIYLAGIVLSILTGRLFRSTLLRGADAPFVMELPPYRLPMLKSLMIHMWDRSKIFLRKMGGLILIGSVVVWVLSVFPRYTEFSVNYDQMLARTAVEHQAQWNAAEDPAEKMEIQRRQIAAERKINRMKDAESAEHSFIGMIGKGIEPVFAPLGIDWRGGVALLTGFVAKEIVVSTLGVLYAVEENEPEALSKALLQAGITPLAGLSMMVFVLLYLPCLATVAAIRRETGSVKWMLFSIGYNTSVAWLLSFLVYQGGRLLGYA